MFEDRIIFLGVQVDDASANDVMAQLLTLEGTDPDRDITMYINSPGGSFTAMTAIYDTMQYVRPDIQTVCLGQAASAAAVLLAAGTPGKRMALPNSRIIIHQPATEGGYGQGSDIEIQAREILRMRTQLEEMISRHSGPADREGPQGHRPRQDHDGRGGQGVRPGRHRPGQPQEEPADRRRRQLTARGVRGRPGELDWLTPDTPVLGVGDTAAQRVTSSVQPQLRGSADDERAGQTRRGASSSGQGRRRPADERRENVGGTDRRRRRPTEVLLLWEVAEAGQEAHRGPRGLHLRRVHRPLQRDHRGGAGRVRRGEVGRASQADGDLPVPRQLRGRAGPGQEGARRSRSTTTTSGSRPSRPARPARAATSSWPSPTSCSSAPPAAARPTWRRPWPGCSTCRSRSPTPPR